MVLEDFPTPLSLLFGGYIIGAGYLAFISYMNEEYSKIDSFDKLMISLVFGFLGFTIIIGIFGINIDLANNQSILNFLKASPIIFLFNVIVSKFLMEVWEYIHNEILSKSILRGKQMSQK